MFQLTVGKFPLFVAGMLICEAMAGSTLCAVVDDPGELPVPSALITALNLTTSKYYSAKSDSRGRACFDQISEGLYSVEAGATGFLNVRYYPVHILPAAPVSLAFRLPVGDASEGGIGAEAILTGTLRRGASPVPFASICALDEEAKTTVLCVQTTNIGEYAMTLVPGNYTIEIRGTGAGEVRPLFAPNNKTPSDSFRMKIVLPSPGTYRNLLAVPEQKGVL